MLAATGAATLTALCKPKLMKAEAPASRVAIVRCRDYAQYEQQLSRAFDQIGYGARIREDEIVGET